METGKIVFEDTSCDGVKNRFADHLKEDGFIIHRDQSQILIVTFARGEAAEVSLTIEKLQRNGNFSPVLRELNRKLISYLKAVNYYGYRCKEKSS